MTHAELTTCADYQALLRGVLADPAADLPRLVLADWLEENGDGDRAAFVREHVEYRYRHDGEIGLAVVSGRAGGFVVVAPATPGVAWTVARGFVSAVTLTLAAFIAHAPELFAAQPITAVTLTDRVPSAYTVKPAWLEDTGDFRGPNPARLPAELFAALPRADRGGVVYPFRFMADYADAAAAHAALSVACVDYARGLVGLPPLSPAPVRPS